MFSTKKKSLALVYHVVGHASFQVHVGCMGPKPLIKETNVLIRVVEKFLQQKDELWMAHLTAEPILEEMARSYDDPFQDGVHSVRSLRLAVGQVELLPPGVARNLVSEIVDAPFLVVPGLVILDGFLETRELDIAQVLHEVVHTAKKSLVFHREKHRPSLYEKVVPCNMEVCKMAMARNDRCSNGCYTLAPILEHLLIIVRVVDRAVLFFACFPREARATPRTPHLVATALLEDPLVTFRAFLGILLEQLDRVLVLHRTLVRTMLFEALVDMTVRTDKVLTETTLVTG